jgi:hypothetical protein
MTEPIAESGEPRTAEDAIVTQAAELATEVTEAQHPRDRRGLTAAFSVAARSGARVTGQGWRAARRGTGQGWRAARRGTGRGTDWLATSVVAMAPRLRVRNQAALQAQFPGLSADEIADALITGAARASATVGAAVGVWAALPALPAFPAEVLTETLALVGIEIKLTAELHEAYGMAPTGNPVVRASAYVAAWADRRGVFVAPAGLILAAGSPLARRLQRRLAARAGRSAVSLAPLLTGAAAGALLNSRETRRLGQDVRADLRRRLHPGSQPPPLPGP